MNRLLDYLRTLLFNKKDKSKSDISEIGITSLQTEPNLIVPDDMLNNCIETTEGITDHDDEFDSSHSFKTLKSTTTTNQEIDFISNPSIITEKKFFLNDKVMKADENSTQHKMYVNKQKQVNEDKHNKSNSEKKFIYQYSYFTSL